MAEPQTPTGGEPRALHRAMSDLPFVTIAEGAELQLLQVDIEAGLWVIRTRLQPGLTLKRHRHTGEVFAFTIAGVWKYLEYPEVNRRGSYLFEPAGSVHTLHTPSDNTETTDVWFAIRGANLELDAQGAVETVIDAGTALAIYRELCRGAGHPEPAVIGA
ncbi:MAG: 2,4'-dihydroxyacetophenone dioxygenase family protein [Hyphomonadaceae bacterium]|nr:2,4'-dihydroxyacetophenone dioxygenase family protein [Hyphomonadaceae bacterium]